MGKCCTANRISRHLRTTFTGRVIDKNFSRNGDLLVTINQNGSHLIIRVVDKGWANKLALVLSEGNMWQWNSVYQNVDETEYIFDRHSDPERVLSSKEWNEYKEMCRQQERELAVAFG